MKRVRSLMWVTALAVATPACTSPMGGPGPARPIEPAALYGQMCARCHALDGHGVPELREPLKLRDLNDPALRAQSNDDIERVIMAGRNQMPGFGGQLSPAKIQELVGYVKRLGTK